MRRFLAALFVLTFLAGCGSVPDSGPPVVVSDKKVRSAGDLEINVSIPGPPPGGAPEETASQLLAASATTQNRARLADEFLVESASEQYTRATDTLVVRFAESPRTVSESRDVAVVQLSGQVIGAVTPAGVFRADSYRLDLSLRAVRVGDVWRLATAPPGVLVRDSDFGKAFRAITVYFPTTNGFVLTPERRYVDGSLPAAALATPVVQMLLGGPSEWLSAATRRALPSSARLRGNVTTEGSDVVVDLMPEIESVPADDLNVFAAQVGWSLRGVFTGSVRLLAGGRPIAVRGVKPVQGRSEWSHFNPAAVDTAVPVYFVRDGRVRRFDDDEPKAFRGVPADHRVRAAAISMDGQGVAVVRRDGDRDVLDIGDAGESLAEGVSGAHVSRPSWGYGAYAALATVDGQLVQVSRAGQARQIAVPGMSDLREVRVALDGVRVALVAGDEGAEKAYVGVLVVPDDGAEPRVERVREVKAPLAQVEDVAWSASTTLLMGGRESDGMAAVWEVTMDTASQSATPRNGLRSAPVSVAAIPTEPNDQPIFLDLGGQLYQRFRESWTATPEAPSASAPFYPG